MDNYMNGIYNRREIFKGTQKKRLYFLDSGKKKDFYAQYVEGQVVLDYGCGNLTLPLEMRLRTRRYESYDNDTMNNLANYHSLNDISGVYDVIIASHVFEHYDSYDELLADLEWCRGHCKRLIVSVPNHNCLYDSLAMDSTHHLILNNADFLVHLDRLGFEVESIILSEISNTTSKVTTTDHLRHIVRGFIALLLLQSPFYNYTIICNRRSQ